MSRCARILIILLPVAVFAGLMFVVRDWLAHDRVLWGLGLLLGALALLALAEGLLCRYWLLPQLGEAIGERIYGGTYVPGEDALAVATARAEQARDPELLRPLAEVVRAQADRTRGWLELARLQQELAAHPEEAAETLQEGARCVRDAEDRALLLYRAAHLYEAALHRPERARELYAESAARYPQTTYGKKAAEKA